MEASLQKNRRLLEESHREEMKELRQTHTQTMHRAWELAEEKEAGLGLHSRDGSV